MPIAPPRACSQPQCAGYAVEHSDYCEKHVKRSELAPASTPRRQEHPYRRLYDSAAWRKHLQPFILARDPLCTLQITDLCKQHNGDASTVADHVRDHKGNPALFFDRANVRGVCAPCHNKKTGLTAGGADPDAPTTTGEGGKQFQSSGNDYAVNRAVDAIADEIGNVDAFIAGLRRDKRI